MNDIFRVSPNTYRLRLLLCCLRIPFHQLASPPGFQVAHIPKGNLVLLSIISVVWPVGLFSPLAAGLFSCSLLRGTQGAPPNPPRASLGPSRGPRHVLWEFKVASPLGEGFRARRTIYAHANPRTYYLVHFNLG